MSLNMLDSDEDDEIQEQTEKHELDNTLRTLEVKLMDLNTCNDLIVKHGAALQRSLSELEHMEGQVEISAKIKAVNERATVFRITTECHDQGLFSFSLKSRLCVFTEEECHSRLCQAICTQRTSKGPK